MNSGVVLHTYLVQQEHQLLALMFQNGLLKLRTPATKRVSGIKDFYNHIRCLNDLKITQGLPSLVNKIIELSLEHILP